MSQRLSYEESWRALQRDQIIDEGEIPALPERSPRYDDEVLGVNFFRTALAEAKLENLTLPRTYFGRSEIRATSFQNTDLSESTANWNDLIDVSFKLANLSHCDLRACLLERVSFVEATLTEVDFRGCGFKGCDFSGADLTGAKLTKKAGAALRLTPDQQAVIDWQSEDGDEPDGG